MSFLWPSLLGWLVLVPLLAMLYILLQQRRKEFTAHSGLGLMEYGEERKSYRDHLPALIFLFGIALLLFSLSRPQAKVSLPKYEGTVVLVFDVSGSMAATDIEPTRMEAAKTIASDFVSGQPSGVRIGVVAFSDGGLNVQSPGINHEGVLATIHRLVPRRGTSLGNGILVALNTITVDAGDPPIISTSHLSTADDVLAEPQGWYPSAVIVLFSDGENNDNSEPLLAADLAAGLGVRIYTVGVGSVDGATIKVEGMNVHTQLNEELLTQIAENSGGQYYYAADETELRRVYNDLEPSLSIESEKLELTSFVAGFSILVFLIGGVLSLLWLGRVI